MTFSSLTFLIFFAIVYVVHWLVRRRSAQNLLLVIWSYIFYGWWDWRFGVLMLVSSLVDFGIGAALGRETRPRVRRSWMIVSYVVNLGLLGLFKYFNFFLDSFVALAARFGWDPGVGTLQIILPVGISFYTFQTLSYTIDIYRGELQPARSLVDYLAFVSFFPQLVAGPIERASNLLPQFARDREFDPALAADGARQALWGLFKKLAIADRLAPIVDAAYSRPDDYSGVHLAFATICFAFQIYCDFSAYSDIAVGVAKQFNITLMRNFDYPYFSQGFQEFWRRWHISLSTWLRDYVYIPLGGSRGTTGRKTRNIVLTFLISGLWHGAAWTYVAWGGLHGALAALLPQFSRRSAEDTAGPRAEDVPGGPHFIPRLPTLLRMLLTFAAVCLCWVLFRAESLPAALGIIRSIGSDLFDTSAFNGLRAWVLLDRSVQVTIAALLAFVAIEWACRRLNHPLLLLAAWPMPARWVGYTALFWGTVLLIPEGVGKEFIYFDF